MSTDLRSRRYLIKCTCFDEEISLQISEVTLAHGMMAYAVRFSNSKCLFLRYADNTWKVLTKNIVSIDVQKQIIKEINFHNGISKLLSQAVIVNPIFPNINLKIISTSL